MNKFIYLTGFLMAISDSLPGISGGTIAYILGQYENLINSIANLKDKYQRKDAIIYLLKLGSAWIIGLVLAIFVITSLIQNYIYQVSSLFLGLIIFSIVNTHIKEKNNFKFKYIFLLFTLVSFLIVIAISYFGAYNTLNEITDINSLTLGHYIYLFLVGMLVASMMLLPGISGSTLLLIFGLYFIIIESLHQLFLFNFEYLPILIVFSLGCITGALLFVNLLKYLFENYHGYVIYSIQGLLLGSIYSIIVSPVHLGYNELTFSTFSIMWFVLGILLLYCLYLVEKKSK